MPTPFENKKTLTSLPKSHLSPPPPWGTMTHPHNDSPIGLKASPTPTNLKEIHESRPVNSADDDGGSSDNLHQQLARGGQAHDRERNRDADGGESSRCTLIFDFFGLGMAMLRYYCFCGISIKCVFFVLRC